MAINDWPATERPREKLLQRGPESLSDAELLAIFLRTGTVGVSAVDLARQLLAKFGDLRQLLLADQHQFCQAKGLGLATYVQLQATLEISRRHLEQNLSRDAIFSNSQQTRDFLVFELRDEPREVFSVLLLDSQNRLIRYMPLFYGTIDSASVYPREVVRLAINHQASKLIFAHNWRECLLA